MACTWVVLGIRAGGGRLSMPLLVVVVVVLLLLAVWLWLWLLLFCGMRDDN